MTAPKKRIGRRQKVMGEELEFTLTRAEVREFASCATTDETYWMMPDGRWFWEELDDVFTEVTEKTVEEHTDGGNGVGIMVFKSSMDSD